MRLKKTEWFMRGLAASLCIVAAAGAGESDRAAIDRDMRLGFTEPSRHVEIAAAESGIVEALMVEEGHSVTQGMALARLDSQVLQAHRAVAQARATATGRIDSLSRERDLRRRRYERLQGLKNSGAAHADEVDRAEADLAIAEANLREAKEQRLIDELEVGRIDALLERRVLRSPVDGVVTRINRDVGEQVSPSKSEVMTVASLDPLRVVCYLRPADAARLGVGAEVGVVVESLGQKVSGRVEFISPVVDAESGTIRTKLRVPNPDRKLPSGVRCHVLMPE